MRERAVSSMTEPVRRKPSQRAKVRMASSRVVQTRPCSEMAARNCCVVQEVGRKAMME